MNLITCLVVASRTYETSDCQLPFKLRLRGNTSTELHCSIITLRNYGFNDWYAPRLLRNHCLAWERRHGGGVSCPRHEAETRGSDQAIARRVFAGLGSHQSFST